MGRERSIMRGKTGKIIFKLRAFSFIYLPSIHPSLTSNLVLNVGTDAKANTAVLQSLKIASFFMVGILSLTILTFNMLFF